MATSGDSAAITAAYAAQVQAISASGAIIQINPDSFTNIVLRSEKPLVVTATGGVFKRNYSYLTSYKGLIFYTRSSSPLMLPASTEIVTAKKIWVPN